MAAEEHNWDCEAWMSFMQETSALNRVTADKLGKHNAINRLLTNAK